MSSNGRTGASHAERIARATGLIRALSGVVEATVESDTSSIRSIAVLAEPDQGVWEVTRNIQSALLASLGLSVPTAAVHVKLGQQGDARASDPVPPPGVASPPPTKGTGVHDDGAAAAVQEGAATGRPGGEPEGELAPLPAEVAAELRLATTAAAADVTPGATVDGTAGGASRRKRLLRATAGATAESAENAQETLLRPAQALRRFTAEGTALAEVVVPREEKRSVAAGATIARLELQAQPSGRIACRAVVANGDHIYAGQASGADTPAGRLEAAARAVLAAALRPSAELDGIKLMEVAGRRYVIAAIRSWSGRETVYYADIAPVGASPEAAAARATLDAILQ